MTGSCPKSLLQNDRVDLSFRQRNFLLRRGIFLFWTWMDSSVAKWLFQNDKGVELSFRRQEESHCHSYREAFCLDEESFRFRHGWILQSPNGSFRMTRVELSFRQRSFLLRRGIFLLSTWIDSSVAKWLFQNDRESPEKALSE
jgi:hypothetical protein